MDLIKILVKLLKLVFGIILGIFIAFTILILFMSGNDGMGTEEKGYFNLILIADLFFGMVYFILWKFDNKIHT